MTFLSYFANRVKLLRISHNLSMSDLSLILNLGNSTVVSKWELEKNGPSNETLGMISNLFGVSLDWLYGNTTNPYNENLIASIEDNILNSQIVYPETSENLFNKSQIPEAYLNPDLRAATYSVPVRANIAYLLNHEATILAHGYYHYRELEGEPLTTLRYKYCKAYSVNPSIFLKFSSRHEVYNSQLRKLLISGKNSIPIFPL